MEKFQSMNRYTKLIQRQNKQWDGTQKKDFITG